MTHSSSSNREGRSEVFRSVDGSYDDGDLLYVSNSGSRSVSVIDVAKLSVIGNPVPSTSNCIYIVHSISGDVPILKVEDLTWEG